MTSGYMSKSDHWVITYKRKAYKKSRYKKAMERAAHWFYQMSIDGKVTIV